MIKESISKKPQKSFSTKIKDWCSVIKITRGNSLDLLSIYIAPITIVSKKCPGMRMWGSGWDPEVVSLEADVTRYTASEMPPIFM